jgi:hypothetical protein
VVSKQRGRGVYILEKLRRIINELRAMQRIDYAPGSIIFDTLDRAIDALVIAHDIEACTSVPSTRRIEEND